ncbi:hypothetical protein [Zunongwangia pacifica]|uniref:Uncharacterized protein n=1 Tax=Zunongwangia pacifica TaxID=2911062 RepID=A0A9X1ZPV7_9FLAO|nr:hypothetical protein [Zunongwangia pacifica]MCL6218737.1 hypothetical protein [Zunongwangia pacifica]
MKRAIFGILLMILASCVQDSEKEKPEIKPRETEAFTKEFAIETAILPLETPAKKYASKWAAYIVLNEEVKQLKNTSVNYLIDNSSALAQLMETLQATLPDSLDSKPVKSRLRVLTTKAKILEQKSHLQIINPEEVKEIGIEIPMDFNNLNIQLNELFIESIEDFEAELDRLVEENRLRQQQQKDSLETATQN